MKQENVKRKKSNARDSDVCNVIDLTEFFEAINSYMKGVKYREMEIFEICKKHLTMLSEDRIEELACNFLLTRIERYEN